MAFASPFEKWYCCLHPAERGMVADCVLLIDRPTMSIVQGIYDLLQLTHFVLYPPERAEAFNEIWSVVEHVPTGLPPPLDELTVFLGATWRPIFDAFDAGEQSCDSGCDFYNFDSQYSGLPIP